MDQLEMVQKLVDKTGIGYEEARQALADSDWDLLQAVVNLERQGKVGHTRKAAQEQPPEGHAQPEASSAGQRVEKVGSFITRLIDKGSRNYLQVKRDGRTLFRLSLTVLVLVGLIAFWAIFPGMLIGYLVGWRYSLEGPDMKGSKEYQPTATGSVE